MNIIDYIRGELVTHESVHISLYGLSDPTIQKLRGLGYSVTRWKNEVLVSK